MLRSLEIRDMLIIDRLELQFQPGLNVLTGETGAGKSILLDSLGFVLGWRGRAELVRAGAEQGEVIAEFDLSPDHPAHAVLEEAGLPVTDELILRRINTRDGRKTAWVNDRRCSGEILRRLSEGLVELHGQHDDRGLLNPRGHRILLDTFGQLEGLIVKTRAAWRDLAKHRKALAETEAAIAAARAEEDFLRHAVAEFNALSPEPGEDEALDKQRRQMQGAARVRDDVAKAFDALGLSGAEGQITDAMRWLDSAAEGADGQLDEALNALGRAAIELSDAQQGIETCLDHMSFNPADLEDIEERLFAIRALARKHGILSDDLPSFGAELSARLEVLDNSQSGLGALQDAVRDAEERYEKAAYALTKARQKAAKSLDKSMAAELAPLKMERAVFETCVTPAEAGPDGTDEIAFTVATNPGAPSGPLNKIASGGELSRFLLALKVCLTAEAKGLTMIFDEIDRGVGGATADAVGRRLAALADDAQVLCVTHSPQVAALGGHHWRVQKSVVKGQTLSTVVPLSLDDRIEELGRMLSGDTVTPEARAAAQALLAG